MSAFSADDMDVVSLTINVGGLDTEHRRRQVMQTVYAIPGVTDLRMEPADRESAARIVAAYQRSVVSAQVIRDEIERIGCDILADAKPSGRLRRFLDKLAESNAHTYGSRGMSCCDLNRQRPRR